MRSLDLLVLVLVHFGGALYNCERSAVLHDREIMLNAELCHKLRGQSVCLSVAGQEISYFSGVILPLSYSTRSYGGRS